MPGYNHFPWCKCGWCSKNRRTKFRGIDFLRMDAVELLRRHNVRSIRECYVAPNAACPICRKAVFFYANASGSRVFFDELGPPWSKHGCTDNSRMRGNFYAEPILPPEPRPRGITIELIEAANLCGLIGGKSFGTRNNRDWTIIIVKRINRNKDKHEISGKHLDSLTDEMVSFNIFYDGHLLNEGDIVLINQSQASFIVRDSLKSLTVRFNGQISKQQLNIESSETYNKNSIRSIPIGKDAQLIKKNSRYFENTHDIEKHFEIDYDSRVEFLKKMRPYLSLLRCENVQRADEIANLFNSVGLRTAIGALWTPKLVQRLLRLSRSFHGPLQMKNKASCNSSSGLRGAEAVSAGSVAEKLSRIGRVSIKRV